MNYTKGEWLVSVLGTNIMVDIGQDIKSIAKIEQPELIESNNNARLLVVAVNECQVVNPDNPLAVAESIKEMYEALNRFLESSALCRNNCDNDMNCDTDFARRVVARVEEGRLT